ncbi:MAG: heavy-metal-associated domain-containing protein [Nitrospinae bacterium]|nr:heavy-metal-associated domain-containing protein [Nitrospinota bacterium]
MANKKFKVEGMSCNHCVETIRKAVGALAGVRNVSADLEKKEVAVDYDERRTDLERVCATINEAGFEATGL